MAAPADPLRISLIGHSYIRRLQSDMDFNPDRSNLGYKLADVNVECFGMNMASLCNGENGSVYTDMIAGVQNEPPCIAYIHLGENDLCHSSAAVTAGSIIEFTKEVATYAKFVIVSQLVPFPTRAFSKEAVLVVNSELENSFKDLTNIRYWKHRGGFWSQSVYSDDGIHLNEYGSKVYWYSVRNAVGKCLKLVQNTFKS